MRHTNHNTIIIPHQYERNRQCGYGVRKNRVHVKLVGEIYTIGCLDKAFEFFRENIMLCAGLAVGFTLPLVSEPK